MEFVVPPGLSRFERGVHIGLGASSKKVDLTVDEFGEDDLWVLGDREDDAVGLGELITLRVDLPVIGVSLVESGMSPTRLRL